MKWFSKCYCDCKELSDRIDTVNSRVDTLISRIDGLKVCARCSVAFKPSYIPVIGCYYSEYSGRYYCSQCLPLVVKNERIKNWAAANVDKVEKIMSTVVDKGKGNKRRKGK